MELVKENNNWKLFKGENLNDFTVETPEGFKQYYKFYRESSFDDAIVRGWIWIDKEYFIGGIINSKIEVEKRKKQIRSDKVELFLKTHNITKEAVVEKLKPILVKAKEKFELCKNRLFELQKELDCDIDYTMLGDTYGIHENYLHISFAMDNVFCKFEVKDY